MPNINVIRRGVVIGCVAKLSSGSSGISTIRNLSQSLALLKAITRGVGILQMVFINSITTTHLNKSTNRPLMSSMVVGGCKYRASKRRILKTNCYNCTNFFITKMAIMLCQTR